MPLFDSQAQIQIPPAIAAHAVHRFLRRCATWAREQEIPKRIIRVEETEDPAEAAKLHEWIAYLRFTEHALQELESGKLDSWFNEE